jgi:mannitol 2-dehydrogenase
LPSRTHVRRYLERFLGDEAIPTLIAVPGHPPTEYAETVLRRFANTGVRDQIARLCIDGASKFPTFLIPTVEAQLELGGPVRCAALALAGWARYLATVPPERRAPDSHGGRAAALARRSLVDSSVFLTLEEVFPPSLRDNPRFRDEFTAAAHDLAKLGPHRAIERALA